MCKFFSLVSDGHGSIRYFSAKERTEIEEQGNPKHYEFDSHSSICNYFEINEDKWNKYEYNPFTKDFVVDILNNTDDSAHVEKQVRDMDFNPIFETGLFDIDLSELESLENVTLPKKMIGFLDLSSLKSLENFVFPEECYNIDLESCTELNNVKLPQECVYINLRSLKSLENFVFPEKCEYLTLNLINSSEVVLPEKHGTIYFKDKTVYSNL